MSGIDDVNSGSTDDGKNAREAISPSYANLRSTAMHGGAYLFAREIIGIVIRVLGVVIVAREIGPHDFGIYAGAAAFTAVVSTVAQMGMEIYLIRQPEEPTQLLYDEVFTFLLLLSFASVAIAFGLSILVVHVHPSALSDAQVFRVLLISVPLNVLWAPAQAKIERSFGFKRMAWLELGGDLVLYGVSAPLALTGLGPYAPVIGFICWQAWLLVGSFRLAQMFPRLRFPGASWIGFLRHGFMFSASSWVGTIANLANPIVVGRNFGATGVGYVSLALRLVDTLGFAQRAMWRLGLAALSKVQSEGERAKRGVEEGMVVQVLAVALPMIAFAIFGTWVIPLLFGSAWRPALAVFAILGAARILNAPFTIEFALLYSRGLNQSVVMGTFLNAIVVFGTSFLLVPVIGIRGYGVATVLGGFGWFSMHLKARQIQEFDSRAPLPWLAALIPPVLFPLLPSPTNLVLLSPILLLLIIPALRDQLLDYARTTAKSLGRARS